jgi:predicted transcriptional regulator
LTWYETVLKWLEQVADMGTMTFARWLKLQIDERLMTVPAFAKHAGIPLQTLKGWLKENNGHRPRGDHMVRLARALGIDRQQVETAFDGRDVPLAKAG